MGRLGQSAMRPAIPSQEGPGARADVRPGARGFYRRSGQCLLKPEKIRNGRSLVLGKPAKKIPPRVHRWEDSKFNNEVLC